MEAPGANAPRPERGSVAVNLARDLAGLEKSVTRCSFKRLSNPWILCDILKPTTSITKLDVNWMAILLLTRRLRPRAPYKRPSLGCLSWLFLSSFPRARRHIGKASSSSSFFALSTNLIGVYFARYDPALLEERMKFGPHAEMRPVQTVLVALAFVAFCALPVVSALDHRPRWSCRSGYRSSEPPLWRSAS